MMAFIMGIAMIVLASHAGNEESIAAPALTRMAQSKSASRHMHTKCIKYESKDGVLRHKFAWYCKTGRTWYRHRSCDRLSQSGDARVVKTIWLCRH